MAENAASPSADEAEPGASPGIDSRRWLRDLGALLALPALWVDHDSSEIATGLLSVLFGVLGVDSAYACFDDALADHPLEVWRPSGPRPPPELETVIDAERSTMQGIQTREVVSAGSSVFRVTSLVLTLPWAGGIVGVSSSRIDFPTAMETHLLRVAVSQAAIAIHTSQRFTQEREARRAAVAMVRQQNEALRLLLDDVEPALESLVQRIKEATRSVPGGDAAPGRPEDATAREARAGSSGDVDSVRLPLSLTRRETEVLGLLAQGLSNKEIAGTMWLSDRTVERHITSLYRKIGVARRSEATAFALRHGVSS